MMFMLAVAWAQDQAAWDLLRKELKDGNPAHRRQTLAAVGSIGAADPNAVRLVEDGLGDKDPLVRQTAAAVLGEMKATQAASYLREALDDKDEVAFAAAKALTQIGDPGGRQMFIDVLSGERKDQPGFVTSKVRDAKKKVRSPEQLAMMGVNEASGALLGPAGMGIGLAEEALKDKGSAGKVIAIDCLTKDPDPYAVALLEWAADDSSHDVRAAAAKGLGQRGSAKDLPKLQALMKDDHTAVRAMAAAAVVRIMEREQGADRSKE